MTIFTHVWVSLYETQVFRRLTVVNGTLGKWGVTFYIVILINFSYFHYFIVDHYFYTFFLFCNIFFISSYSIYRDFSIFQFF